MRVEEFIRTGVLPEVLSKWFTVPRLSSRGNFETAPEGCYCGNPSGNKDILSCTSEQCKRKHFHKSGLKLSRGPNSWKCVECNKQTKLNEVVVQKRFFINEFIFIQINSKYIFFTIVYIVCKCL